VVVTDDSRNVDRMFEEMFGFSEKPKPPKSTSTPVPPQKRPKRPKGNTTPDVTPEAVERAAKAVRDAVVASNRKRPVKTWKEIAKESLGVSYLKTSLWKSVIDRGIERGLFKQDSKTLSFTYLIALDEPEKEPEPSLPEVSAEVWTLKPVPPEPPPEERRYTYHLACGHPSGNLRKRTLEDGTEEVYCVGCELKSPPDHRWMSENRGIPMPERRRRSEANPTGDCCDENGQYIGGLEGDCRYGHLKDESKPVCAYHADKPLWGRK